MYVVFDSINEELIGPYNTYEDAQMFILYASEGLVDGGANLTIEAISEPQEWAVNNGVEELAAF